MASSWTGSRQEFVTARWIAITVAAAERLVAADTAVWRPSAPNGLGDDQIERLGQALIALEQRMGELKEDFGLSDTDLNLDLGPLGRLL